MIFKKVVSSLIAISLHIKLNQAKFPFIIKLFNSLYKWSSNNSPYCGRTKTPFLKISSSLYSNSLNLIKIKIDIATSRIIKIIYII